VPLPILVQIALGGALGATLRYLLASLTTRLFGGGFPWGTFAVNLLGCFLMGIVAALVVLRADPFWQRNAPLLMTGILGGFTTFSAFALETHQLLERERLAAATAYAGGSVVLGVVALIGGLALGRHWAST
jgi:fluoride exporter